jgi:hypothetical protein
MAVALLVRFDLPDVELWWHGRHERIEPVKVALAHFHIYSSTPW